MNVNFDLSVKPKVNKKPAYSVHSLKKANLDVLQEDLEELAPEFTQRNYSEHTVDENWNFFNSRLKQTADSHIPKKQVKSNQRLPC